MLNTKLLTTAASVIVLTFAAQTVPALAQTALAAAPAAAQTEDARLDAFFEEAFKQQVALSPEFQTQLGMKTNSGKLDDYTEASAKRRLDLNEAQVAEMKRRFDYKKLSPASQLSYRLFENGLEQTRIFYKWRWHGYNVSTEGTTAGQLPVLLINAHRVDDVSDAEAYVSRLREVERVMNEVSGQIAEQQKMGIVAPSFAFDPVLGDARNIVTGAPFTAGPDTPLWADFKKKVAALKTDDATKARLLADGEAALKGPFLRGYNRFLATVAENKKAATSTDGVWRLPNGIAYYNDLLRFFTTTDSLNAEQIHQIGLDEVARLNVELQGVMNEVGYKGTRQQFFDYIRNDPKFHYPNTDAGKQAFLDDSKALIAKYMEHGAPLQFSRLPKAPLEVRAVEKWREKTAPIAFYNQPSQDGTRPGIYYVNLADMTQVNKAAMEDTACHEGAPGHHFQIARAQEQEDLPVFRQQAFYGAYIEGWGLYAERLCKQAGGYADPYSEAGRIAAELWRASRLVVDTGLHAKRWSRDQAIAYFKDNTMLSDLDVTREINRYIASPGQATSYKIGQLRILELRARAEKALGPKFDLKAFHEVVLSNGALPLDVLGEQIDAWIASRKAA
ncbi:MAG: DUF885 domain-containing protein [Caulobacteraceae bacterium]